MHNIRVQNYIEHEQLCESFTSLQNIKLPETGSVLQFTTLNGTQYKKFTAYLDTESILKKTSDATKTHKHDIVSYYYVICDETGKVIYDELYTHSNPEEVGKKLVNSLYNNYNRIMQENKKLWNVKPILSNQDWKNFNAAKKCEICNSEFRSGKDKARHHNWNCEVVIDSITKKVIKGNYLGALCFNCNSRISLKRDSLCVFAHNNSNYDSRYILQSLQHLTDDVTKNQSRFTLLPKHGESLISIEIAPVSKKANTEFGIRFLDSFNFISESLDNITNTLSKSNHTFENLKRVLSQHGIDHATIEKLLRKNIFPYEYLDDYNKLFDSELPPHSKFYSSLKKSNVSEDDYAYAQYVFKETNCSSLKDYLELYLKLDTLLLMECFNKFRQFFFEKYGLDASHYVTLPSYAMQCALFSDKTKISLICDIENLTLIEKNIRGGLTSAIRGRVRPNDPCILETYNAEIEASCCVMLDFNSLYGSCMVEKLPYGPVYELTEQEINNFDYKTCDSNGDFTYFLLVDFNIPDHVRRLTDDLPLGIRQYKPKKAELSDFTRKLVENAKYNISERLIACHHNQKNYLISLKLLQLYICLGVEVQKVSKILRFKQTEIFKNFINQNISLRNSLSSPYEKKLVKLLSNSIYGKCLYNSRKNSEEVKLITRPTMFKKHCNNPLLKDIIAINEDCVMMKLAKKEIVLNSPIHIGFYILELSKYKLLDFYYNVLKKNFGKNLSLCYCDTDSYLIHVKGFSTVEFLKQNCLKEYIDFSNFTSDLYSNDRAGKLGCLKSEVPDAYIKDVIILQPKCYSIQTSDGKIKMAAKGVPKCCSKELRHQKYVDIHNNVNKSLVTNFSSIRSIKYNLFTRNMSKRSLCKLEIKRHWLSSDKSLAFGHPDIEIHDDVRNNDKNTKVNKKRVLSIESCVDLTARKKSKVHMHKLYEV
jgi:hypothetical protein